MRVAIGSDHAGFALKEQLRADLTEVEWADLGTHSTDSCDYPDLAVAVARAVQTGEAALGVLVCGTGVGMAMTANKLAGIRAAVCTEAFCAEQTRLHNNANVLCLGARVIGPGVAAAVTRAFLRTPFSGDARHQRRIDKITAAERGPGA